MQIKWALSIGASGTGDAGEEGLEARWRGGEPLWGRSSVGVSLVLMWGRGAQGDGRAGWQSYMEMSVITGVRQRVGRLRRASPTPGCRG